MVDILEFSVVAVGAFLAMCMFSTLYGKSSPLYSLAEESYIGFATGLTIVVNVLYIYRTGILGIQAGDYILIIGVILGILITARVYPKFAYLSRIPIAITLGSGLGLSLRTTIFTGFIDQIRGTVVNLFAGDAMTMLYRWTIALCVIFTLPFFLYTIELKGPVGWTATIGEYLLYIAFGGSFAQTFMGRLGLFVGFMQYYTVPPWKAPILIASMIIVLATILILDRTKMLEKLTPAE